MSKSIQGKVARILSSRELALNIGSKDGVIEGMLFDILDSKGEDIRDPDTNEILGSIQRPKVRVKVTQVQAKLSVASTFKATEVNLGGTGNFGAISSMLMPPKYVKRFETLKTNEATWEDLDESESYVKTGDPVISVRDMD